MWELNLLPPSRQHLKRDAVLIAAYRVCTRVVLSLGALTLAGAAAIGGLMMTQRAEAPSQEFGLEMKEYQTLRRQIISRNAQVTGLQSLIDQRLLWSELLPPIFAALPPGTVVASLDGNAKERKVIVKGQSPGRSAVITASERLAALPQVKRLDSPANNLLQRERSDFSFTVYLADELPQVSPTPTTSPVP